MAPKKDDPIEKLRGVVREEFENLFKQRERKDLEAKDPWEKLRGIVRDEMAGMFDNFGKSLDAELGKTGGKEKPEDDDDDDTGGGEPPKLGILGF